MLLQVKASAGSGKTFELTSRFLRLLQQASDGVPAACGAVPGEGYGWSEIMAVTFTNKAAAEMKERVVSSLKDRALGETGGPAGEWSKGEAALWLTRILRHYHQLNIRTIDSLLNMFMRIFALEIGVAPDFDVIFDVDEVFAELFDGLTARAEDGGEDEQQMIRDALSAMLHMENKPGFNLCQSFRERLTAVLRYRLNDPAPFQTDPRILHDVVVDHRQRFTDAARSMQEVIAEHNVDVLANFAKFLDKCVAHTERDDVPKSTYIQKSSLADCVKKAAKNSVPDAAEDAFAALQTAWTIYKDLRPVFESARNLAPFIPLADRLLDGLKKLEEDSGVLLNGQCPAIAHRLLDDATGVPDAYCRMGTRLMYMLIDEFQDTGRDQWLALRPLTTECVAKGGGMFFVGDVKQAIYGWRGGDARLFDEIPEDEELSAMVEATRATLPRNWRSSEVIVDFNNQVFERLADPATARVVANAMQDGAPKHAREAFAENLITAFTCTAQEVAPPKAGSGGYVRLERVFRDDKAELFEAVRDRLHDMFLGDLLRRRPCSDVAVLVRSNAEASEVSRWLIEWGVPVITENSLSLAEHPIIRQLAALMTFLDYPFDDLALWEFVSGHEIFLRHTGLDIDTLTDWLATCERGPLFPRFREAFPEAWDRHIAPFQQQAGLMSPYDMVREVAAHFHIIKRHPQDELFVRRFMEVVHAAEESGRQSLSAFLEYWTQSGGEEKVPLPESIDAVRVMTIHQSKGLEFPVCVVPFHHWNADPRNELVAVEQGPTRLLVHLRKELDDLYWNHTAKVMQEQLNLLYVAWTRPVEELYCLLTSTKRFQGYPFVKGVDALVGADLWQTADDAEFREHGVRPRIPDAPLPDTLAGSQPEGGDIAPLSAEDRHTAETPARPMAWLPRLKIHRHFEDDLSHEELLAGRTWDERARGTLMHTALDRLRVEDDMDAATRRAAESAVATHADILPVGAEARSAITAEADDILRWVVTVPGFLGWREHGAPECPILDAEGNEHRPDLLVTGPEGTHVVEYKTGAPDPAHEEQVRRYLRLVAAMDALPAPHHGTIIYLDRKITVDVSPRRQEPTNA